MALTDTVIKMVTRQKKDGEEVPASDRVRMIKSKAGLIINVFAALLAFNMWLQGSLNSKVLNNTIQANDLWVFYQAKSIKQTLAEMSYDDAVARGDKAKAEKMKAKIERYESDPEKGEGKKELFAKAKALEEERDVAKKHGPWMTFAGTSYQLAIVLLSASILAVSMSMFFASIGVSVLGFLLMSQGIWMWMQI